MKISIREGYKERLFLMDNEKFRDYIIRSIDLLKDLSIPKQLQKSAYQRGNTFFVSQNL